MVQWHEAPFKERSSSMEQQRAWSTKEHGAQQPHSTKAAWRKAVAAAGKAAVMEGSSDAGGDMQDSFTEGGVHGGGSHTTGRVDDAWLHKIFTFWGCELSFLKNWQEKGKKAEQTKKSGEDVRITEQLTLVAHLRMTEHCSSPCRHLLTLWLICPIIQIEKLCSTDSAECPKLESTTTLTLWVIRPERGRVSVGTAALQIAVAWDCMGSARACISILQAHFVFFMGPTRACIDILHVGFVLFMGPAKACNEILRVHFLFCMPCKSVHLHFVPCMDLQGHVHLHCICILHLAWPLQGRAHLEANVRNGMMIFP
eukprot:823180-Pelagomonas_calceolata.AAC.3